MKMIRLFAVSLFVAALFTMSAIAQPAAPSKIAVINTFAFGDEKAGINKYVGAVKTINAEFAPVQTELETLSTKLNTLAKEIQTLRDQAAGGKVPIDEKAAQSKVDEAEKLQRDIKFKQEDAKARLERRQQAVMGPVMQDIGKALQEFAKQKGFTVIFDIAKDEQGFLLAIGDDKADVTKDFIVFYNARPAGTAATTTPK
jgi:Skp family chaperone for outer membrane proteins